MDTFLPAEDRAKRRALQWGHGLSAMDTILIFDCIYKIAELQWGHGLSAMDTSATDVIEALEAGLQWGHGLSAMDTGWPEMARDGPSCLQWGHGLSAMDTPRQRPQLVNGTIPSMGPWPFSHGYVAIKLNRAWRNALQWGHGLSAMDTPQQLQLRYRSLPAFNGAMAFQPWIHPALPRRPHVQCGPSMGPWPFSHGYFRFYF